MVSLADYFKDWVTVLNSIELIRVLNELNQLYKVKPICPARPDVFKAFELCSRRNCKVVFIGQD